MYRGLAGSSSAAGVFGAYSATPGQPTSGWSAERDYFLSQSNTLAWIDDPRWASEFAKLYGAGALQIAANQGIVPENFDPVAVGGTILNNQATQRTVYFMDTGEVAFPVHEKVYDWTLPDTPVVLPPQGTGDKPIAAPYVPTGVTPVNPVPVPMQPAPGPTPAPKPTPFTPTTAPKITVTDTNGGAASVDPMIWYLLAGLGIYTLAMKR